LPKEQCAKIIREARLQKRLLDPHGIFVSQTDLINDVNKEVEPSVFNNFVPNYKSLANIYQMFSLRTDPKSTVILEELVTEHMSRAEEEEISREVDFLVVESFVSKFNAKYDSKLLSEQKTLLNLYISSFVDNSLGLKMFLNEELRRLKNELSKSKDNEHIASDDQMLAKTTQIIEKLEDYKNAQADQNMLLTILKIQQLVGEINNDANSN
jgi:hypothetical protein